MNSQFSSANGEYCADINSKIPSPPLKTCEVAASDSVVGIFIIVLITIKIC